MIMYFIAYTRLDNQSIVVVYQRALGNVEGKMLY